MLLVALALVAWGLAHLIQLNEFCLAHFLSSKKVLWYMSGGRAVLSCSFCLSVDAAFTLNAASTWLIAVVLGVRRDVIASSITSRLH